MNHYIETSSSGTIINYVKWVIPMFSLSVHIIYFRYAIIFRLIFPHLLNLSKKYNGNKVCVFKFLEWSNILLKLLIWSYNLTNVYMVIIKYSISHIYGFFTDGNRYMYWTIHLRFPINFLPICHYISISYMQCIYYRYWSVIKMIISL